MCGLARDVLRRRVLMLTARRSSAALIYIKPSVVAPTHERAGGAARYAAFMGLLLAALKMVIWTGAIDGPRDFVWRSPRS